MGFVILCKVCLDVYIQCGSLPNLTVETQRNSNLFIPSCGPGSYLAPTCNPRLTWLLVLFFSHRRLPPTPNQLSVDKIEQLVGGKFRSARFNPFLVVFCVLARRIKVET